MRRLDAVKESVNTAMGFTLLDLISSTPSGEGRSRNGLVFSPKLFISCFGATDGNCPIAFVPWPTPCSTSEKWPGNGAAG